jgi:hypothetical protein
MKLKSLHLQNEGSGRAFNNASYRKLGKHSYLINETLLVIFLESEQGFTCMFYKVSPIGTDNFHKEFLEQVKIAITQIHEKNISKTT